MGAIKVTLKETQGNESLDAVNMAKVYANGKNEDVSTYLQTPLSEKLSTKNDEDNQCLS